MNLSRNLPTTLIGLLALGALLFISFSHPTGLKVAFSGATNLLTGFTKALYTGQ